MRSLFEAQAISVGELCRRIRRALRAQFPTAVRVIGEISKCRVVDGNAYFALKDSEGLIDCICFRAAAEQLRLKFPIEDGTALEVTGFVDIYEAKSSYQLRVSDIVPIGLGALHVKFEELKRKLEREGLFDVARKRPIPTFISDVAIVTSKSAAALQDFVVTCRRRGAHVRILVQHAPVQGAAAAPALARAIIAAGKQAVDVVVVARGGGTTTDLWAFNTEEVARAIAGCAKPVISAIGHETDSTIADFVADKRVATPTAAAEFVAQEREALLERIERAEARLRRVLVRLATGLRPALARTLEFLVRAGTSIVSDRAQRLDDLALHLSRGDPRRHIRDWHRRAYEAGLRLEVLGGRVAAVRRTQSAVAQKHLAAGFAQLVQRRSNALEVVAGRLAALGPRQTLRRGYAIVYDRAGGVLTDSAASHVGEAIGIELKSGWLGAIVKEKKDDHGKDGIETD
jgi:exodeoxyribonuclease VII large subunit